MSMQISVPKITSRIILRVLLLLLFLQFGAANVFFFAFLITVHKNIQPVKSYIFYSGFAQTSQGLLSASNGFITVSAKAGDDVDLDCSEPGVAMATVSLWHAKIGVGMRRLSPSSQTLLQNGSIFTVLHIPLNSFGQYECRVADGGPVERTIKKFNVYHIRARKLNTNILWAKYYPYNYIHSGLFFCGGGKLSQGQQGVSVC